MFLVIEMKVLWEWSEGAFAYLLKLSILGTMFSSFFDEIPFIDSIVSPKGENSGRTRSWGTLFGL